MPATAADPAADVDGPAPASTPATDATSAACSSATSSTTTSPRPPRHHRADGTQSARSSTTTRTGTPRPASPAASPALGALKAPSWSPADPAAWQAAPSSAPTARAPAAEAASAASLASVRPESPPRRRAAMPREADAESERSGWTAASPAPVRAPISLGTLVGAAAASSSAIHQHAESLMSQHRSTIVDLWSQVQRNPWVSAQSSPRLGGRRDLASDSTSTVSVAGGAVSPSPSWPSGALATASGALATPSGGGGGGGRFRDLTPTGGRAGATPLDRLVAKLDEAFEYQHAVNCSTARASSLNYIAALNQWSRQMHLEKQLDLGRRQIHTLQNVVTDLEGTIDGLNQEMAQQTVRSSSLEVALQRTQNDLAMAVHEYRQAIRHQEELLAEHARVLTTMQRQRINQDFLVDSGILVATLWMVNTLLVRQPLRAALALTSLQGRRRRWVDQLSRLSMALLLFLRMRSAATSYGVHQQAGAFLIYFRNAGAVVQRLLYRMITGKSPPTVSPPPPAASKASTASTAAAGFASAPLASVIPGGYAAQTGPFSHTLANASPSPHPALIAASTTVATIAITPASPVADARADADASSSLVAQQSAAAAFELYSPLSYM
ncbi:hypothetical protein CXG81DRAFT_23673 [Caulochytrium protostelioides]|uniref:Uncharacterized protein n=1 Tax=Caulochytrium protostelioides TaxID=1555241 RepID=A0A4P9XEV9_9FUNG|nr:hypothetical protein CXG81DRAFT_23673 [Caulochytrium protostelioides]|eukprot:RKP03701.1 hypothetical protein CXG81DRAFT_23673 [Caulochytrium protostelioides]